MQQKEINTLQASKPVYKILLDESIHMQPPEETLTKNLAPLRIWTNRRMAVSFIAVLLLTMAGLRPESAFATDKIRDDSVICKASSSEGGTHDVRFVLGAGAMGSLDHEDACQYFHYDLAAAQIIGIERTHMITEKFYYDGQCGDNGANGQICENYGLRITSVDVASATEENNVDSNCLGVLEDDTEGHFYYLLAGTPCEPYYSLVITTQ